MDVTKSNFLSVLSKFESYLKKSEFVAIDEEMTGMRLKNVSDSCFDALRDSYANKRQIASSFGIIQVGVCLFEKNDAGPYTVRPFNFYCFPSSDSYARIQNDPLVLEPDGISFLRRHNMDFQKWVYEGVGYCTKEQEDTYRAHLAEFYKGTPTNVELAGEDLETASSIINFITEWLGKKSNVKEAILPHGEHRIAQKYVKAKLPEIAPGYEITFRGKQSILAPSQDNDKEKIMEERLLNFSGFREIFKLLVKHQKPIVGHNMLMDLFFLIRSVDCTIPESVEDFQKYLENNFPSIWDTKVLSSKSELVESKFKSTSLQNIFDHYTENPAYLGKEEPDTKRSRSSILDDRYFECMEFPLGFERYATILRKRKQNSAPKSALAHEAAYDALCTGFIFLQLKADLGIENVNECHNLVAIPKSYSAINTSSEGPASRKLIQGSVLRLEYQDIHDFQVEASLAPLKGKVEWRENGTAAAVLKSEHTVDEGLEHYKNSSLDIKATPYL